VSRFSYEFHVEEQEYSQKAKNGDEHTLIKGALSLEWPDSFHSVNLLATRHDKSGHSGT